MLKKKYSASRCRITWDTLSVLFSVFLKVTGVVSTSAQEWANLMIWWDAHPGAYLHRAQGDSKKHPPSGWKEPDLVIKP